jgi:hypothetical protein
MGHPHPSVPPLNRPVTVSARFLYSTSVVVVSGNRTSRVFHHVEVGLLNSRQQGLAVARFCEGLAADKVPVKMEGLLPTSSAMIQSE